MEECINKYRTQNILILMLFLLFTCCDNTSSLCVSSITTHAHTHIPPHAHTHTRTHVHTYFLFSLDYRDDQETSSLPFRKTQSMRASSSRRIQIVDTLNKRRLSNSSLDREPFKGKHMEEVREADEGRVSVRRFLLELRDT